jgi:hypothetical protein
VRRHVPALIAHTRRMQPAVRSALVIAAFAIALAIRMATAQA